MSVVSFHLQLKPKEANEKGCSSPGPPSNSTTCEVFETEILGAMKEGRGTCGTFKPFNLTYLHTTFIDIYNPWTSVMVRART